MVIFYSYVKLPEGMLIVTTKIWSMMNWCQTHCHPQLNAVERAPMIEIISIHLQIYIWGWVKTLVPLVNPKIAGKWMFIPLKMVLIGIDPIPIWLLNPETIAFLHSNQAFSSSCSGNSQGTRKSSWMVNTDKPPIFLGMVYINHLLFLVKLRLVSYCFTNING